MTEAESITDSIVLGSGTDRDCPQVPEPAHPEAKHKKVR